VTSLNSKARIDQLETENERKDDRIARLETETDPDDTQGLIEVRTDDEDPTLEDVWIAGLPFGNIIDAIETKVSGLSEVEERIDDLEARASSQPAESAESDEQDGSITPMERVLRAGEAGVLGHVTASVKRVKAIAEHFGHGRRKAPRTSSLFARTSEPCLGPPLERTSPGSRSTARATPSRSSRRGRSRSRKPGSTAGSWLPNLMTTAYGRC